MDLNEILTKERDVLRDENIELRNKIKERINNKRITEKQYVDSMGHLP